MPRGMSLAAQYQQKRCSLIKEQRRRVINKSNANQDAKKVVEHINGKRIVSEHHSISVGTISTEKKHNDGQYSSEQMVEVIMKGNKQSSTPNTAKSTLISPNSDNCYALRRVVDKNENGNASGNENYSCYNYSYDDDYR